MKIYPFLFIYPLYLVPAATTFIQDTHLSLRFRQSFLPVGIPICHLVSLPQREWAYYKSYLILSLRLKNPACRHTYLPSGLLIIERMGFLQIISDLSCNLKNPSGFLITLKINSKLHMAWKPLIILAFIIDVSTDSWTSFSILHPMHNYTFNYLEDLDTFSPLGFCPSYFLVVEYSSFTSQLRCRFFEEVFPDLPSL